MVEDGDGNKEGNGGEEEGAGRISVVRMDSSYLAADCDQRTEGGRRARDEEEKARNRMRWKNFTVRLEDAA